MKKQMNVERDKKRQAALFLFLVMFFVLTGFHEFFHSHEADTEHHTDCVVFIFLAVAKAPALCAVLLLTVLMAVFFKRPLPEQDPVFQSLHFIRGIRGPPSYK